MDTTVLRALRVFRALRILRAFKLSNLWEPLSNTLTIMYKQASALVTSLAVHTPYYLHAFSPLC